MVFQVSQVCLYLLVRRRDHYLVCLCADLLVSLVMLGVTAVKLRLHVNQETHQATREPNVT